jgi:hypothetical protein
MHKAFTGFLVQRSVRLRSFVGRYIVSICESAPVCGRYRAGCGTILNAHRCVICGGVCCLGLVCELSPKLWSFRADCGTSLHVHRCVVGILGASCLASVWELSQCLAPFVPVVPQMFNSHCCVVGVQGTPQSLFGFVLEPHLFCCWVLLSVFCWEELCDAPCAELWMFWRVFAALKIIARW